MQVGHYSPLTDLYFLEGALSLLDAETEWAYDRLTRKLHFLPRGGASADPNGMRVQARVLEYALAMTDASHVVISGMRFFGTTLYAAGEGFGATRDLHHVTFDSLELIHPSAMKRNLGNVNDVWPTTLLRRSTAEVSPSHTRTCRHSRHGAAS